MKSFCQFIEQKVVEAKIEECARLMVCGNVDPEGFASRYFEKLDSKLSEGFWSDMMGKAKDAWGRWSGAAGKVAKSVVDGGLRHGLAQGHDMVAGPKVKFDKAIATLRDVAKFLQSNEKTKGMASETDRQLTISQHLEKMIEILSKEIMPVLGDPQVTQNYNREGQQAQQTQQVQQQPQDQQAQPKKQWQSHPPQRGQGGRWLPRKAS